MNNDRQVKLLRVHHRQSRHKCDGMAMLSVLFIVMAIVAISMGYLHRADMAAASGNNMAMRTEADYLAWAGLERARALVQTSEPNAPLGHWSAAGQQLDNSSNLYYDLSISDPNTAAAIYVYSFSCEAYALNGSDKQARSVLSGRIYYDTSDGKTTFGKIVR